MAKQRFLFNTKNRRVVSYNPLLATRKDMVECDSEGRFVDPLVAASLATTQSAGLAGLTPLAPTAQSVAQAVIEQPVNPVADMLAEEEIATPQMEDVATIAVPEQVATEQIVNPVGDQLDAEEDHRDYCMTKGLSSLNRAKLTEIAVFFDIVVVEDDTNDDIKEKIEEARALV